MPAPERRWSGAFRTCPACGRRNFVGRAACTACGAGLRLPVPPTSAAPASFIGHRSTDRFQGRVVMVVGGAVALVAVAAGLLVSRSLRGVDWALLPGAVVGSATGRSPSSAPEMEAPALPAFPRPEDRASYDKGRRLLAAGDAKGALGPLTEAALGLPHDPAVVHDYGLALVSAGQEDLGLFQLEHASRLSPGTGAYRLDLIRALLAAGRRGAASRELGELLARDPANLEARELLASLTDGTAAAGASPDAAAGGMDLGGAAGGAGSPHSVGGSGAFTNEDLERRRTAAPTPVMPSPAAVAPSAPSPAPPALPSPSA